MKKLPEHELIRIAFGEASEEETRRLLADSEPGTAMKLDLYRRLRADLRDLATDVPEPQLSQERLQEAILRAGLKRERRAWSWSWAFAPMAALAIGVLFINRRPDLVEPLSNAREAIAASEIPAPAPAPDTPSDRVASAAGAESVAAPVIEPTRVAPSVVRRSRPARVAVRSKAKVGHDVPVAGAINDVAVLGMEARTTTVPSRGSAGSRFVSADAAPEPARLSAPTDAMVVLIASETDAATGANLAIEVASTSNVVIGS